MYAKRHNAYDVTIWFQNCMIFGIVVHALIIILSLVGPRTGLLSYSYNAKKYYKCGLVMFFTL